MMGEPRHRRSHVYDVATGARQRLFANNTIRTITPEYIWLPSADGSRVLIQAERDGDTVSVERGVYVVDLTRKVTAADRARPPGSAARGRERPARAHDEGVSAGRQARAGGGRPRRSQPRLRLREGDVRLRLEVHHSAGQSRRRSNTSRRPTVRSATTRRFSGSRRRQLQATGGRTGNIVATLAGTENPELIYVVSSHFDSVAGGPGADDDTSGTAALLEAARILAPNPLPVTVVFASFTGEEAGLLGSREFVRLAAEQKWNIVGALNNDMIGWGGEGSRMDNTIRYSNAGHPRHPARRGVPVHAPRPLRRQVLPRAPTPPPSTKPGATSSAASARIRCWRIPNYHQPTDFLETMNHQQIVETAKVDGGDARLPGVEPVAAEGRARGEDGGGRRGLVDAEPGGRGSRATSSPMGRRRRRCATG